MTKIEYNEVDLDEVIRYFALDFKTSASNPGRIYNVEWFIDPIKNKVVYKVFIDYKEE